MRCEVKDCKNKGHPVRVAYQVQGITEHATRVICKEHLAEPKGFHVLEDQAKPEE